MIKVILIYNDIIDDDNSDNYIDNNINVKY